MRTKLTDIQSMPELKKILGKKLFSLALSGKWSSKKQLKQKIKDMPIRKKTIYGSKSVEAAALVVEHTNRVYKNLKYGKKIAVPSHHVKRIHRVINTPIVERLATMVSARVRNELGSYRYDRRPEIERGNPGIVQTEYLDWDYYSKSCKYPKKIVKTTVTVSKTWSRDVYHKGLARLDGMLTIAAEPVSDNVYKSIWLEQRKGYTIESVSGWIAVKGSLSYHSTKNSDHALAGLQRKAKQKYGNSFPVILEKLKKQVNRNPDAPVTWSLALSAACKPGITNWLYRVGIDPDIESVPVSRVLQGYEQSPRSEAATIIKLALRQSR